MMVDAKHTDDCVWRTKNNVKHENMGYGECRCDCHGETN